MADDPQSALDRLRSLLDGLLQDAAEVDLCSAAGEHATDTLAAREGFVQGIRYAVNVVTVDFIGKGATA